MKDEPRTLDEKREKDRRLALLTLAGGSPPAGPCLDAETLAALVEGRLATAQREACLAHLAGCDTCAALWLHLDQEWQRDSALRPRSVLGRFFARPRTLAAAGSMLAAAASIAVFLNLTSQGDRQGLIHQPQLSAPVQVSPAPAPPAPEQRQGKAKEPGIRAGSIAPQEKPAANQMLENAAQRAEPEQAESREKGASPSKKKAEERLQTVPSARAARPAEAKKDAASGTGAMREQTAADAAAPEAAVQSMLPPASPMAEPRTAFAAWRQALRRECKGPVQPARLSHLQTQGQSLALPDNALVTADLRQLERLLALLAAPQPAEARCRAILAELGPADGR